MKKTQILMFVTSVLIFTSTALAGGKGSRAVVQVTSPNQCKIGITKSKAKATSAQLAEVLAQLGTIDAEILVAADLDQFKAAKQKIQALLEQINGEQDYRIFKNDFKQQEASHSDWRDGNNFAAYLVNEATRQNTRACQAAGYQTCELKEAFVLEDMLHEMYSNTAYRSGKARAIVFGRDPIE